MAMKNPEGYIKQNISKYRNKELTKSAILTTIKAFPDLRPKFDTFVFSDNTRKQLLSIDGTIPVNFRGAIYNIPICIWLFDTHPFNPPMCYVKPTQSMMIKSSKHVDAIGRVYLPYLHEWKHPNADLIGLIQVMTAVFSENPPVFARPANQPMTTGYPGTQPPPMPQPTPAGYPAAGSYQPGPMPMPTPTYPAQGGYPGGNNPYRPPTTGYPSQYPGQAPYPSQPVGMPAPQPPVSYPFPSPQQNQVQNQYSSPPGQAPTDPPPLPPRSPRHHMPLAKADSQQSISDEQIKASLQSAVEDKLKRRMREVLQVYQNEMDALTTTRDKLQEGKSRITQIMTQMEQEQRQVEANTRELRQKNEEIEESLKRMEGREELDPEEAVSPTTPLYKQLLNLVADEMTIEDTYYYLMEALRKDVIELEVFLKHVRELSRNQYLLRAHIQKVRQIAGLTPA